MTFLVDSPVADPVFAARTGVVVRARAEVAAISCNLADPVVAAVPGRAVGLFTLRSSESEGAHADVPFGANDAGAPVAARP